MIKKWELLRSEHLSSNRVFSMRKDTSLSPVTGKEHDFYVIEAPDWINVVAVTDNGEVLLIKQYRHGIGAETVEIPGGVIDPGETPLEAAKRELLEETGYVSDNWSLIGEVIPNPAIQNNKCYTFLAESSRKAGVPRFDSTEYIVTFTAPVSEIPKMVSGRKITHSLVIDAFYWFCLHNSLRFPYPSNASVL
ncbi:MAG: NUDIX hydrolase [Thermodesulfobacteriota bacterium]|jgi:8-oxo-dGTP pyrophosphatase MutT (NUDIX family)